MLNNSLLREQTSAACSQPMKNVINTSPARHWTVRKNQSGCLFAKWAANFQNLFEYESRIISFLIRLRIQIIFRINFIRITPYPDWL